MMYREILFLDNSDAILYYPGRRLLYLLMITTCLHIFILLTIDFAPLFRVLNDIKDKPQRAVSINLEKNLPPQRADFISIVDQRGVSVSESENGLDVQTKTLPLNSVQINQIEEPVITSLADRLVEAVPQAQELMNKINTKSLSELPRIKVISAATHQHQDAAYLYRWQQYVEAIGSEFYPKEALEKNITGKLRLLVAILEDGSVKEISIRQTSGSPLLDQAAVDIIRHAQPFEPIPKTMLADNEIVEIIRTWDFRGKLTFSS